jgi:hypothetical protein
MALITVPTIYSMSLKAKKDKETGGIVTTLSFDTKMAPGDVARLLNMYRQDAPLELTIACHQLMFDLDIQQAKMEMN